MELGSLEWGPQELRWGFRGKAGDVLWSLALYHRVDHCLSILSTIVKVVHRPLRVSARKKR